MNLKFLRRVSERELAIRQFVIIKNKLTSVFNASVLFLTINFVITLSKKSAATLTMSWRNSWSITGQTHKKLRSFCGIYNNPSFSHFDWFSPMRTLTIDVIVSKFFPFNLVPRVVFYRFLRGLQQNRAQSRLLCLLIIDIVQFSSVKLQILQLDVVAHFTRCCIYFYLQILQVL